MGIAEKLQKLEQERRSELKNNTEEVRQFIVQIAIREATRESLPRDPEDLLEALEELELPLSHYTDIVNSLETTRDWAERLRDPYTARDTVLARAELKQVQKQNEVRAYRAQKKHSYIESRVRIKNDAVYELSLIAKRYPEFFTVDGTPRDEIYKIPIDPPPAKPKPRICKCCGGDIEQTSNNASEFCSRMCIDLDKTLREYAQPKAG